jgi:predicted Rdx family selenoprotein
MAAGLAAELKVAFKIDSKLIKGGGGIFQVHLDGDLVFDKKSTGRFPILGEVSQKVSDLKPERA